VSSPGKNRNFRNVETFVALSNTASRFRKISVGSRNMKTRHTQKVIITLLTCVMLVGLYACGSGSGGNSGNTSGGRGNTASVPGVVSIGITDAVVDSAEEVWVQFTGISIQPSAGDTIDFTFDSAKNINLLSLQGTTSADLIRDAVIPLGSYDWIRLHVNANNDGVNDSYIKLDDGSVHELWIPSGSQTGLKINSGFELAAADDLKLMIDFDLRKSVVESNGDYTLRPTLRMVDISNTGSVSGTIDAAQVTAANCSDADPLTGNAVYLFEGADAATEDLRNGNQGPLTSASVELNVSSGEYEYMMAYVPAGNYTLAFTCQADMDDPAANDNIVFNTTENITVTAEQITPTPGPVR
jgi:hypothetical protein